MRSTIAGVALATLLAAGLACSGMQMPAGGGKANVAACKAYVEAFNAAPCTAMDQNPAELCPATLDAMPCDWTDYYKCMSEAVQCHGEFVDISGQANCTMPNCS